ncbi:hypothetical protein [Vibrio nomapromontoriensis]|uniref:hypothetical protein n=1 Tax=Vibrio nomapromontoriensis TaxID=2910246 RepID=UPI003D0F5A30
MHKGIFISLILAMSSTIQAREAVEFARDVPQMRGIEILDGRGTLALGGESFSQGNAARFRLTTNSESRMESVVFISRSVSRNTQGMDDKIEISVGGYELDNRNDITLESGVYLVQARLNVPARDITQGEAKVMTIIEIR